MRLFKKTSADRRLRRLAVILSCSLFVSATAGGQQVWQPISSANAGTISGMAVVDENEKTVKLIVVHDRDRKDKVSVVVIDRDTGKKELLKALAWRQDAKIFETSPKDLEAITKIPGEANSFVAFDSHGYGFCLKRDETDTGVDVKGFFKVKEIPGGDFEGFALQTIADKVVVAVWADRGTGERPAKLVWGVFDRATCSISERTVPIEVRVLLPSFPLANVHDISDIKVDTCGTTYITAAYDSDNDNANLDNDPKNDFYSELLFAGTFVVHNGEVSFAKAESLLLLHRFPGHKAEGFAFLSDKRIAFGTDDENSGSKVLILTER